MCPARAYGTATWAPACSWSVLELRIVMSRPVEGEVLDVERAELGAPQRGGESEQQQRPIAQAGEGVLLDRLDEPRERVCVSTGAAWRMGAVPSPAADPGQDGGDGAGVARVGVVLGALRM